MKKLNLNFKTKQLDPSVTSVVSILEDFGKQISEYSDGYFTNITVTTTYEGAIKNVSLYILAPYINVDYKIIEVELTSVVEVEISFFTLITKQVQKDLIRIDDEYAAFTDKVRDLLGSGLANASFKFLMDQIDEKKKYSEDYQ